MGNDGRDPRQTSWKNGGTAAAGGRAAPLPPVSPARPATVPPPCCWYRGGPETLQADPCARIAHMSVRAEDPIWMLTAHSGHGLRDEARRA